MAGTIYKSKTVTVDASCLDCERPGQNEKRQIGDRNGREVTN